MDQNSDTRQFREVREFYAKFLAASSRSSDPRIERAFELVPREAFLPPGPWKIYIGNMQHDAYIETPSADPIHLYHNVLVALDENKGLNNGQPSLHAAWLGAVAPKAGESVLHIGAGRGYYTAILSILVLPDGNVKAFELNEDLATAAREHLMPFENATVTTANAVEVQRTAADVIYVNAGVTAPPAVWLQSLRPGGRLIFPWRPSKTFGMAIIVTRKPNGFETKNGGLAFFTPCIGASDLETVGPIPDIDAARRTQSIRLTAEQKPDATATAVYKDVWFSADKVSA